MSSEATKTSGHEPSKEPIILHGELEIWILEAKSLPNMDLASEHIRKCFTMFGNCKPHGSHHVAKHSGKHSIITSDPYVSVCLAGATVAQTRVIANCENPLWDEHFLVPVAHPVTKVEFHVKDNDVLGAQHIGVVEIAVEKIINGDIINEWFPIINNFGNCLKPYPELHISIQLMPFGESKGESSNKEVGNAYFPLRKGGNLTLYQDAHTPDNLLPEISFDGGIFPHSKCIK